MRYFYIDRSIHLLSLVSIFFAWLITPFIFCFFLILTYGAFLYLFRRKKSLIKENSNITGGVLYAPSQGRVVRISKDKSHPEFGEKLTEILVRIPWLNEYGIYLPFASEVKEIKAISGSDFFRFSKEKNVTLANKAGVMISLEDQKGEEIGIQLLKCTTGLWPEVKVMPGDRGKCQANIGLLPLGGTLALYIPSKYEILVQQGQDLVAGESLIAGEN